VIVTWSINPQEHLVPYFGRRKGLAGVAVRFVRLRNHRALQSLGDVCSELFVPLVETRTREHLRADKLQRDWEWTPEDRR
jgi:hypothetical protein